MICQKKNKRLLVFCLSFLLFCLAVTPCLFSVRSYASETTTQSVDDYFREHNFYETCAFVCRKYASFPYTDYLTGASSGIIYDNFADYLESKGKSNLLQEDVTITGTGGGRGYDIPQEVRQEMLNFVQEIYINEKPLGFSTASIPSYNFLNPSIFSSYDSFLAMKNYIKNSSGYVVLRPQRSSNGFWGFDCFELNRDTTNFIGTVDSSGSFTNVRGYTNWTQITAYNMTINPKHFNTNGTFSNSTGLTWNNNLTWRNLTGFSNSSDEYQSPFNAYYYVFTNQDKNEYIYVFNNLNALKNYNSGNAQNYYMPTNSQSIVPYYDGFTQSDINSAGNFYNNIVINTEGDNPNDIKKKTDSILGSLDSVFGGSDSESSSGGLFDSLGDIITGATGAISPIKEIVLGDIKELVADVFDFLPPTIITLWVSGIIFGIFFGVLKLIRG